MDKQLGFFPKHWESPSPLLGSDFMPFGAVDTCGEALDSQHLSQGLRREGQERPVCSPAPPHSHSTTASLPPCPSASSHFQSLQSGLGLPGGQQSVSYALHPVIHHAWHLGEPPFSASLLPKVSWHPLAVEPNSKSPIKHSTWAFIAPALPHSLSPGRSAWSPPANPAVAGGSDRPPRAPCWALRASSASHTASPGHFQQLRVCT